MCALNIRTSSRVEFLQQTTAITVCPNQRTISGINNTRKDNNTTILEDGQTVQGSLRTLEN